MHRDEYAAITRNATGRAIRAFLGNAANRQPTTSRTDLRRALEAGGITDEDLQDKLLDRYKHIAEKARSGANLFQLRQEADLEAVKQMRQLAADDDLFGEDGIATTASAEDRQAVNDLADSIGEDERGGADAVAWQRDMAQRSNAVERQRTRTA